MKRRRMLNRTAAGDSARSAGRMARLDPLARRMYADYQAGLTLAQVAAKHCPESKHGQARVHHLFKIRGLKCRKGPSAEAYQRIAATRRAQLDQLVTQMYAEYQTGLSLGEVGRRHGGRSYGCITSLFKTRGLAIRENKTRNRCTFDKAKGCFIALPSLSVKELDVIIARQTRVCRPTEMRYQWERWSLQERGWFIARMRQKLNLPGERPTTPFSANVEPFDYASPRAHEIAAAMNLTATSRKALVKVRAGSQGVIWGGDLWFWARKVGYQKDPWTPGQGRLSLHKTIWEQTHGRKVPPAHIVRYADGNWNNLDPANLVLVSRNEMLRENYAAGFTKKSRDITALLLNRSQTKTPDDHTDTITALRAS